MNNSHELNESKEERLARIRQVVGKKVKTETVKGDWNQNYESFDDTHSTIEDSDNVFESSSNEPAVDFLKFINNSDAYLMLEKKPFPLEENLKNEELGYPLGIAYDELLKEWLICDRDRNKIVRVNVAKGVMKVTETPQLKNPSALIVYKEGKSVAVLCSEDRRSKFSIYIYNLEKQFLSSFASYNDNMYDMRSQMRGLAKSYGGNLLSLDQGTYNSKKLRVFKKNIGSKGFEMKGAVNPSFLASFRSSVAVSDLGVNKVFIFNLNDKEWGSTSFAPIHVISSNPDTPIGDLANCSGFRFVSGMQYDVNGFLLVGDAKGHTIKLFDTEYEFLHRVSSDFGLPFMSSFHINRAGEAMILDVHAYQKLQWAQLKPIRAILPWQEVKNNSDGYRRGPPRNYNNNYQNYRTPRY